MNKIDGSSHIPEPPIPPKKTSSNLILPKALQGVPTNLNRDRVHICPKREHVVLLLGQDEPHGPVSLDLREALSQRAEKVVASRDLVACLLKPIPEQAIKELTEGTKHDLNLTGQPREFIDKEIANICHIASQDIHTYFNDYDLFIHSSNSIIIFRLKSEKNPEEAQNSLFRLIKSADELTEIIHSSKPNLSFNSVLDAFPDTHPEGTTLFICGHGDDKRNEVAGVSTDLFKSLIETLDKSEKPDLVVVLTCYGGGKKHIKLYPGANEMEKVASKTTYVVSGAGSTVGMKTKQNNFPEFFKKTDALFEKGQVSKKRELLSPLNEIGIGNNPVNIAMVRFANFGQFQHIQDDTTFSVNSQLINKQKISNHQSIAVPSGTKGLLLFPSKIDLPLVLDVQEEPLLFFNRDHNSFAISEIQYKNGDFKALWSSIFFPLLQTEQSESKIIYIGKVTFENGQSIHNIKIVMSGIDDHSFGRGQPPVLAFYDSDGNFYLSDHFCIDSIVSNPNWEQAPTSFSPVPLISRADSKIPSPEPNFRTKSWNDFQKALTGLAGFPYNWQEEVDKIN